MGFCHTNICLVFLLCGWRVAIAEYHKIYVVIERHADCGGLGALALTATCSEDSPHLHADSERETVPRECQVAGQLPGFIDLVTAQFVSDFIRALTKLNCKTKLDQNAEN